MAVHMPAHVNLFACVEIEDSRAQPKDKKLVQRISDKLGHQFIASAEHEKTLILMLDLEQIIGKEIIWLSERSYDSLFVERHSFGGKPTRLPSWARRYCTIELKIIPIFKYCFLRLFKSSTDKVKMQIGYRADEMHRIANPSKNKNDYISYPTSCNLYGKKRNKLTEFNWRETSFPLISANIYQKDVIKYWSDKSLIFPAQSNCAGCFHKDEVSLHLQWEDAPEQMQWFADQEEKGLGTWLESKIKYQRIKEMQFTTNIDFSNAGSSCSGGCTD